MNIKEPKMIHPASEPSHEVYSFVDLPNLDCFEQWLELLDSKKWLDQVHIINMEVKPFLADPRDVDKGVFNLVTVEYEFPFKLWDEGFESLNNYVR